MLAVSMLVDTVHPPLEHAEETFNAVGAGIAPDVLVLRMIDRKVLRKLLSNLAIHASFVGCQARIGTYIVFQCSFDASECFARDVNRARFAVAFHQCKHHFLVTPTARLAASGLATDVSFVSFNDTAIRSH